MTHRENSSSPGGLSGLVAVREAVGLQRTVLAKLVHLSEAFVYRLERQSASCKVSTLQSIAAVLGCGLDDLAEKPTSRRLAEIRSRWYQRLADEASAEARDLATA